MLNSIYIELTSVCDMECEFCCHDEMPRTKKHMDFELFKSTVDDIVEKRLSKNVNLFGVGESVLYPKLLEAVNYCDQKNLSTMLFTNGLALTPELYQDLIDSGLKALMVSLHDFSEDSFAYRRVKRKINYEQAYQNIIKLIDCHITNNNSSSLMIIKEKWISSELWDFPAMKENTVNMSKLIQPFINEVNKIADKNNTRCYLTKKSVNSAIRRSEIFKTGMVNIMKNVDLKVTPLCPTATNTRKKLVGELASKIKLKKKTRGTCSSFLKTSMIFSNGTVVPCCQDGEGELDMGKVTRDIPLHSIINGQKCQDLSKSFQADKITESICQECLGELVYKNPFLQIVYRIKSFNLYAIIFSLTTAVKRSLRIFLLNKLSERNINMIRGILRKRRNARYTAI